MNKLLNSTVVFGLLATSTFTSIGFTSAAIGQERSGEDKPLIGRFVIPESEAVEDNLRYSPSVIWRHSQPIGSSSFRFGGKCTSCHTNPAVSAGEASVFDFYVGSVSQDNGLAVTLSKQDNGLAMTLSKPDSTTQSILKLKKDQGVIVYGVCPGTKELASLLKQHDIILTVDDQSAKTAQQVEEAFKTTKALELTVLRKGETKELRRPAKPDSAATKQSRYLVGIKLGELAPVVISQLQLDDSISVFVQGFSGDSSAKTAGMKTNDILLKVDGKQIVSADMLQELVQNSEGKSLTFEVLRDGSELQFDVTPNLVQTSDIAVLGSHADVIQGGRYSIVAPHLPDVAPVMNARVPDVLSQLYPIPQVATTRPLPIARSSETIQKQLQKIEQQLERMTKAMEALSEKQ